MDKLSIPIINNHVIIMLLIIVVTFITLVSILLVISPGNQKPFVDEKGHRLPQSLSEKVFITINGTKQGMFIKSKDISKPILLYLHGGLPEYFLTQKYPTGLENYFTVIWWDQRGSGLSYSPDIPVDSITLDQMIADTLEVTQYARRRFGKDKIYLMGHSGGTFIGIHAAARAPELYHAYIGVAQMSDQLQSEKRAYEYMLEQFKKSNNTKMIQALEAAPVTTTGGIPNAYLRIRDEAMHNLGIGTTRDMKSIITGIFLPSLINPEYSFTEKINLWRGKSRSGVSSLWGQMVNSDLSKQAPQLTIPVYFFHGIYDYTVSYPETKAYFANLNAPLKGFYTFTQSAHSPVFEEPEKIQKIIQQDVLNGTTTLADPN